MTLNETPQLNETVDKPLETNYNQSKKVDINVLKARVQEIHSKEQKRNIFIFVFFLSALAILGVYLSS